MLFNEYVLMELNQQRRAQVADNMAALRASKDHRARRRSSLFARRHRPATLAQPAPPALAVSTGATAH